jgi:carbohydrate-selective porin OprB
VVAQYTFRQYLVERAKGDGWGIFAQVSSADKDTSPITAFFDVGLGGNGIVPSRPRDEFGLSYAYTDLSEVLKDNLALLPFGGRLLVEHQLEVFYNLHLTPWFQLTAICKSSGPIVPQPTSPSCRARASGSCSSAAGTEESPP